MPGGPHAAARARRLVESELNGRLPRALLADVALLTTELVANGVRHGGAGPDRYLRLLFEGSGPGLHVEVTNADGSDGGSRRGPPTWAGAAGSACTSSTSSRPLGRPRGAARHRLVRDRLLGRALVSGGAARQAPRGRDRRQAAVAVEPRQGPLPRGGVHEGPRHRLLHARRARRARAPPRPAADAQALPQRRRRAVLLREAVPVARARVGADDRRRQQPRPRREDRLRPGQRPPDARVAGQPRRPGAAHVARAGRRLLAARP